jgi:hypothetical protein
MRRRKEEEGGGRRRKEEEGRAHPHQVLPRTKLLLFFCDGHVRKLDLPLVV